MNNIRLFISFTLIISTLLTCTNFVYGDSNTPFTDIKTEDWYYDAVKYCHENGIFKGISDTTFAPSLTMTREMFVTALARTTDMNINDYTGRYFLDGVENAWYAPYIQWAYETGISKGIGNRRFGIGRSVSRAEAVTLLYNFCDNFGYSVNAPTAENLTVNYTDADNLPYYSKEAFCWAVFEGIISGTSKDTLSPLMVMTRAQAAQIFARYTKINFAQKDTYLTFGFTEDKGFDVFSPYNTSYSYRYGPTILMNDDGSMETYYSSLGGFSEWDHLNYMHITANEEILPEETVIQPTPGSYDFNSCCDPGAIYFNGYYYVGYTSTIYRTQNVNNVFVARSKSPNGPFEKWNGNGWGGEAMPIIMYNGTTLCWGAGEVAFVELNGTLFIYYTLKAQSPYFYTMVATADATDENWPLTVSESTPALSHGNAQSGADIKYVESQRKFVGVAIENSFGENSYIRVYESLNGIDFTETQKLCEGVYRYSHNIGLSGDLNGHIKENDKIYVSYAYSDKPQSENWGQWATHMQEVIIKTSKDVLTTDSGINELHSFEIIEEDERNIAITTNPHFYNLNMGTETDCSVYRITGRYRRRLIEDAALVKFTVEDPSVLSVSGFTMKPLSVGTTNVTAEFDSRKVTFLVRVYPEDTNLNAEMPEITEFRAVQDTYYITNTLVHPLQIRAYINCNWIKWGEASNEDSSKAVFHKSKYPLTYTVADTKIAHVDENGMITPMSKGETDVTVSYGEHSFTVKVIVTY
ncbi:MAG: S-layer homology domain-containing protein [Clostridia bacterium]|nr:S-layer homology domain-containing protein [Clostridia bacterium]